ncbi:MAG: tetratricopeptide repeat protein [Lewinellaceae bacterium]|nr:tetratricopeptide repeat protein [Lewinellaceae bacterium]
MAKSKKTKKATAAKRSYNWLGWAGLVAILILTYRIYAPSLDYEFINLDDPGYVTGNPYIQDLTAKNIGKIFTEPLAGYYHPLTLLSLALDYRTSGSEPHTYHLVNLLLHLANTVFVFYFVYLLGRRKWIAALFTALFFAIHPMHIESVAWVAQRKEVLYTFFFLPAMISYLYFIRKGTRKYYWLSLGLFVLSLASMPLAGILPFAMLLVDHYEGRKKEWKLLTEKIPFFALSLLAAILTWSAQSQLDSYMKEQTFLQKVQYSSYGLLEYVAKLFAPFNLSIFHPYPATTGWMFMVAPLAVAALIALVYFFLRKNKSMVFGLSFFTLAILPGLQLFAHNPSLLSERLTYLPYIGLLFPLGVLFESAWEKKTGKWPLLGIIATAIALVGAGFFSKQTQKHLKNWKGSVSLWTDVIRKYPNEAPDAYNNRGMAFFSQERTDEALADYNQAISLDSTYYLPILNRGTLFLSLGNHDQALKDLNKGLELAPDFEKGYINRAGVYLKTERFEEAIQDYDKVLEMNPNIAQIYYLRGYAKMSLGRYPEALEDLNTSIEMNNKMGSYYLYRSYVYSFMGQRDKALEDVIQAEQLGAEIDKDYKNQLMGQ